MENIDYQPKQIVVLIGGKEYPVSARTEKVEREIREFEATSGTMAQYESDMALVSLLLGGAAAKELFPRGEDENLDRLYHISAKLLEAYRSNYTELVASSAKSQLNPLIEQMKELSETVKPLIALSQQIPSKPNRKK